MTTELTRMAIQIQEGHGDFDSLLLNWSTKVKLEGWMKSKTLQEHDAQDLRQEVMIDVWNRFGEYRSNIASFETWAGMRARQIIRSWLRKIILQSKPVLKSGHYKETQRAQFVPIDYVSDEELSIQPDYTFYEMYVSEVKLALKVLPMTTMNRRVTSRTFEYLTDGLDSKEIQRKQKISQSKFQCNVRRIRKAINLMEEAKELMDV